MGKTAKPDIYESVTASIMEAIEEGAGTFEMPWNNAPMLPVNVASGKSYNGINTLILMLVAAQKGYGSGIWGTYKQWQAKGAQVIKGAKSTPAVFYKEFTCENEEGEEETRRVARGFRLFNADQVEGFAVPAPEQGEEFAPLEACETFIANCKVKILHGGTVAGYFPLSDHIKMPPQDAFFGSSTSSALETYYSTVLHELTHASGAAHRLNREGIVKRKVSRPTYAFEELIAELGAAFLCLQLGVTNSVRPDHAQYIENWLQALKNDKRAIFKAASQAQAAVDFLQALQGEANGKAMEAAV